MRKFKLLLSVVLVAGFAACTPETVGPLSEVTLTDTESETSTFSLRYGKDTKSITGDKEPLIVLEGKIVSRDTLRDIDPNDIKSINVLKGKSAAAIYGSKGENGVIVITLKG